MVVLPSGELISFLFLLFVFVSKKKNLIVIHFDF